MSRPLCSVVLAAYQRAHLLERSLVCYQKQDFDNDRFELIVVDDHSKDGTRELVLDWSSTTKIKATVLTVSPKPAEWVDCGWILNSGIRASAGDHIILTHPEVMPGRRSVAACVERLSEWEEFIKLRDDEKSTWSDRDGFKRYCERIASRTGVPGMSPFGLYCAAKPYYLSPRDQERIDTVDWINEGPLAVRKIEGFYDDQPGNPDYSPRSIESVGHPGAKHSHWLSWVFGGCSRETWKRLGGMLETGKWGSVDVAFVQRRRTLGIINHTCIEDDTLCIHQSHDDPSKNVVTPRIEELWKKELSGIPLHDPKSMCWPAIDYLAWGR